MVPRFLTILTGRNLPKIQQAKEPEPSIVNEKTIADFMRVVVLAEIGHSQIQSRPLTKAPPESPGGAVWKRRYAVASGWNVLPGLAGNNWHILTFIESCGSPPGIAPKAERSQPTPSLLAFLFDEVRQAINLVC
jgi:hypothetical protein